MNFNNTLWNLSDQATLVFKNVTLSIHKLRYAIDVAMTGSVSDEFVKLLEVQGVQIDVGSYDPDGRWRSHKNSVWFQQGVACEVLQPGSAAPQKGRLKLRVSLEFCPEVAEVVTSNPVMQSIEPPQKVSVAEI